jgi:hypothetical protein
VVGSSRPDNGFILPDIGKSKQFFIVFGRAAIWLSVPFLRTQEKISTAEPFRPTRADIKRISD